MKPIKTVDYVDLDRFMGDWYVIASIPTFIEKDAQPGALRQFFEAIEPMARGNHPGVEITLAGHRLPIGSRPRPATWPPWVHAPWG